MSLGNARAAASATSSWRQRLTRRAIKGGTGLWLGVWQKNERAIGFYRRWKFETVGTQFFPMGPDLQEDWVMLRELGTGGGVTPLNHHPAGAR